MRKYIIFLLLAFLFIIAGCHDSHHFINVDVYAIAKEKYGEVQPIIKNINFFKYLENDLPDIDGLDYLISKSVSYYDTIPENLNPLMFNMDLVIHDNKYQLLIYNRTIRESDDKYKMVLLNDWFFDVSIIDIINALDDNQITFGAPNEWQMEVIKKPANPYPNVLWGSLIDMVYFEEDSKVLVYLNYLRSNYEIVASEDFILIGDFSKKEIIYPERIKYDDFKKLDFQIKLDIPSDKDLGFHIIRNQGELIDFLNKQDLEGVSLDLQNIDFDFETLIVFSIEGGFKIDSLNIRTFQTILFQAVIDQESDQNHIYFITVNKLDQGVVVLVNFNRINT